MNTLKATTLAVASIGILFSSITPSFAGTFTQNHPRRAEVLGRAGHLNNKINSDKGLLGGHYGQLKREDASIDRQEQRDARINGGYITRGQQHRLNSEENRLNNQINNDKY